MIKNIDYLAKYRKKKLKNGLCRECSSPATNGIFCKEHRDKYNFISRQLVEERLANHLCIQCGSLPDPNSAVYCTKHMLLEKKRKYIPDRKISGGMKLIIGKTRVDKKQLIKLRKKLGTISRKPDFVLDDPKEKEIFNLRILSGSVSLRKVSAQLGISHEQVRIVEEKLAKKFKTYLDKKKIDINV